jgi:hypothetical protein
MTHLVAVLSVLFIFTSLGSAWAEAANGSTDDPLFYAHLGVTALGLLFAVRMADQAFARRALPLADAPTFPRYMTSRGQYRLGNFAFIVFASFVFLLIVFLHKEVVQVIQLFPGAVPENVASAVSKNEASYLLVVFAMGGVYLFALQKEANWNVLLMVRDVIQTWISVPQLGHKIVNEISFALTVPPSAMDEVVGASTAVANADFKKSSMSIDRAWAEVSYMRWWILFRRKQGNDATFFAEPSFALDQLLDEYDQLSESVSSLKEGRRSSARSPLATVSARVKSVHLRFARLVACYLLYKNGSKHRLAAEARAFGIPFEDEHVDNPLKYSVIYLLAVVGAVYVGVYGSAIVYDLLAGQSIADALTTQDVERVFSWMMYALSNYGLAIVVVLAVRLAMWQFGTGRQSHLLTYCWTFVVGCLIGPLGLTLAAKLNAAGAVAGLSFLEAYANLLRWGVGPGLVAVCITWFMDRQISSDLPNIDTSMIAKRVFNSFAFALFTLVLQLPQLLTILATGGAWDTSKLRAVAAGVTFTIALTLALVAQFGLRRPPSTATPSVAMAPAE